MKKIVEICYYSKILKVQRNIVMNYWSIRAVIAIYSELFSELELLRNELPKNLKTQLLIMLW
ncbi:hypothetical protein HYD78_02990 [Mycoplasmopsis bovis]|nr:hypothetical protein [Mycoplasmopsis bovis]QQH43377.1 hypothetical protein HYD78_02990 [Mycoplasmopsis bovis]